MAFTEVTNDIELMRPPEGTAYSFNADEDVIAGQAVKVGSDNGVEPSDTDGEQVIGVAAQTVSSGDTVMVLGAGARVRFTAGASVSAGDYLTSHGGTGEEGEVTTGDATGDYLVGLAHEGAGDGDTFVGTVVVGGQVN
jgi:hypothetical protein